MADENRYKNLEDLPPVTVSSETMLFNKTGGWRTLKPIVNAEKCTSCMICWKFCPDACIEPGELPVIDMDYCKGCGICAEECPTGAITLIEEGK